MQLINLTPHPLTIIGKDGTVLVNQAPDGPMARCAEDRRDVGTVTAGGHSIPLRQVGFGRVTGLPAPRQGVLYVVSRATAEAATGRDDVVYPDEQVRDSDGRIIGCRALARAR